MKRGFWRRDVLGTSDDFRELEREDPIVECNLVDEANLIGSLLDGRVSHHAPCIDIDLPCYVIPSSTPGHFHLYFEKSVPWDKYVAVLEAMADAGLVQNGFVSAAKFNGQTFVRPPWVHKSDRPKPRAVSEEPF